MKSYTASAFSVAAFVSQVAAHGYLVSPPPRQPGDALTKACGAQFNNMWSSDINGNVQTVLQVASTQSDYDAAACNAWLCKGMKYEDNKDNVQQYTAGQTVPIEFNIAAPHTGVANMSIIDTASNSIIGEPLITFKEYASTASGVKDSEKNFDITIPSDLGSKCATAGDCVLQFWWDARSIDQTYESCIDFTVGGSGSGSGSGSNASAPAASASAPAASAPASSAPAASAPAATSAAASATPTVAEAEAPAATSAPASGSNTLPEEFSIQQFITWLKAETGATSAKARRHARAFF